MHVNGSYSPKTVAIIGAGPAGLAAAYRLVRAEVPVIVLEAHPTLVGGISRTVSYNGFGIDIGGHRFFSKSRVVEDFWTEILPDDLLRRPRSSSILYRGRFYTYPLRAGEALMRLGWGEAARCVASYAIDRARFSSRPLVSFEDWVRYHFGSRLYEIFFKAYTEKVWGVPCDRISADWATQRINQLSLWSAVWSAALSAFGAPRNDSLAKTLIQSFRYPRRGPGMLWEACAAKITAAGGRVQRGTRLVELRHQADGTWLIVARGPHGDDVIPAQAVISSAPLAKLVTMIRPEVSCRARAAAASLRYRDFIVVALILKERHLITQNWIYVHDPGIKVGRIQNYKAWSAEMVPDDRLCCYGMEYFCFAGDRLWDKNDAELLDLARRELCQILPLDPSDIVDGCVVRQKKAYPIYDPGYAQAVRQLRDELGERYGRLHLAGRNGMHKYNNQDHSVMTGLLCAENVLQAREAYDPFRVNQDAEYIEGDQVDASLPEIHGHQARSAPCDHEGAQQW